MTGHDTLLPKSVLGCLDGVWGCLMVPLWCLRLSGVEPVQNLLAKQLFGRDTQILHYLPEASIA